MGASSLLACWLGEARAPTGGQNVSKMRVDFQFTPNRAELAPGTPHNYPHVTPKDHHGINGIFKFGAVTKLLRVLRTTST